jgi:hypothetical protein
MEWRYLRKLFPASVIMNVSACERYKSLLVAEAHSLVGFHHTLVPIYLEAIGLADVIDEDLCLLAERPMHFWCTMPQSSWIAGSSDLHHLETPRLPTFRPRNLQIW